VLNDKTNTEEEVPIGITCSQNDWHPSSTRTNGSFTEIYRVKQEKNYFKKMVVKRGVNQVCSVQKVVLNIFASTQNVCNSNRFRDILIFLEIVSKF